MGADHLLCLKCGVGYNLESGSVFWVDKFIENHWHDQSNPPKGTYFNINYSQFPKHFRVVHRVPHGYVSCQDPAIHIGDDSTHSCFHRLCMLNQIEYYNKHWTWFRTLIYKIHLMFHLEDWHEQIRGEEPFVVDKNNPKHNWMVAFTGEKDE
jgi:hypothetical protein